MPPKNKDKPQLYILRPDGTKVMLGEIWDSEIICESGNDIYDEHWITQPTQEYEFTTRWNPTTKILYFMLRGDFPTNNWLRMHGYRAERKKR